MPNALQDSSEGPPAGRVAAKAAHDIFNLLTVVYGLQDEIETLPNDSAPKQLIRAALRSLSAKLGEIADRLQAAGQARGAVEASTTAEV